MCVTHSKTFKKKFAIFLINKNIRDHVILRGSRSFTLPRKKNRINLFSVFTKDIILA